jgi:hypothetical protein
MSGSSDFRFAGIEDCLVNFTKVLIYPAGFLRCGNLRDATIWKRKENIEALRKKHHSFQSGKEHVGTETIVYTVNQQYNQPSLGNEK